MAIISTSTFQLGCELQKRLNGRTTDIVEIDYASALQAPVTAKVRVDSGPWPQHDGCATAQTDRARCGADAVGDECQQYNGDNPWSCVCAAGTKSREGSWRCNPCPKLLPREAGCAVEYMRCDYIVDGSWTLAGTWACQCLSRRWHCNRYWDWSNPAQ